MARSELKTVTNAVKRLQKKMGKKGEGNLQAWVQSKITKAADYIDTAADYVTNEETVKEEGLRDWFGKSKSKDGKKGWVNVVTGGTCASDEPGEGTPKCVSSAKRASMTKAERLSAQRRKKAADPGQQEKTGAAKPTYVSTDPKKKMKKEEVEVTEAKDKPGKGSGKKDACYNKVKARYDVWPSAYASGALVKCRKVGADNWGNKTNKEEYEFSENVSSGKSILAKSGRVQGKVVGAVSNAEKTSEKAKKSAINKAKEKSAGEAAHKVASEKGKSPYDALIAKKAAEKKAERERLSSERKAEAEKFKGKRFARIREEYEFSSWRDDFQAMEYEFVDIIKPEPIKGVQIDEIHSSAHTPHEVPSGNIKKLVKKAVKRIDTDADGDVDNNDKAKGELGEFIPGVGNKRLYSMTRPKTAKENFSNWREDLGEDWQKVNKGDKTDGMSQKAVDAYRRENPGSKLKTAVTEKDPGPGRSKRRKSFCARSKGQQDMHNIDCSKDPDKAICKARRRWRC